MDSHPTFSTYSAPILSSVYLQIAETIAKATGLESFKQELQRFLNAFSLPDGVLADLGGQIDYQVRTAFLDIRSAADQVAVAQDNVDLANQTLAQGRDRFSAGVTDNIEVVQAQDSVASANDALISALHAHNVAKVGLARALGGAEDGIRRLLEVK